MAKLSFENSYGKYSVEVNVWDETADGFIDEFVRPVMLAAGYAPQTIDDVLPDCDSCATDSHTDEDEEDGD